MNRREMLYNSGLLSVGLPWSLKSFMTGKTGLSKKEWHKIIDLARWSPSVHNLQPFRVRIIDDKKAELYYDSHRLLPVGDPGSKFSRVAMGVFAETLSIAASMYNKRISITDLSSDMEDYDIGLVLFATLKVEPLEKLSEISPDLIYQRRTSRKGYSSKSVPNSTFKKINKEAEYMGNSFYHSSNKELIDFVAQVNQQALFHDLGHDRIRNELDSLFRYSEKEAKQTKDGLAAKCMGFSGKLLKSVFQNHKGWTKGLKAKLLKRNYLSSFDGTPSIGWFRGKFGTTEELVTAGKMLARAWLRITEDGCYIQPFGSLVTNQDAYRTLTQKLTTNTSEAQLWLIFRIGHSDTPHRSQRLNLETIIV